MAAGPQRRPVPVTHLGAHIVPVERALKARAEALEERCKTAREQPEWELTVEGAQSYRDEYLAAEFRALGEELHHW